MPFGDFVNQVPPIGFLAIHFVAFALGAVFARRAFATGSAGLGWGFALYALGEISYMTYHLDWTTFLFAHTISEVLVLLAMASFFLAAVRRTATSAEAPARA